MIPQNCKNIIWDCNCFCKSGYLITWLFVD